MTETDDSRPLAALPDDLAATIDDHDVDLVQLQFTDITGTVKSVTIPLAQLPKAFEDGIWFDGSSINGFVRINESDMRLKPDPDTFAILPWQSNDDTTTARLICDVMNTDGTPFAGDPRYILKSVLDDAADRGYEVNIGPEPEFFLFETADDGTPTTTPHDAGGYFDLAPKDLASDVRRDIITTLEDMGYTIEASHHEVAEGQHEINFQYDDALSTADNIVTFRAAVRATARKHGLHASFMPKPISEINGSGMHSHISLFKDGENAFADAADEYNLSDTAYQFMGGVLDHAEAFTAVTNPTVNSYKRLVPGYEAPVYTAWSNVNRSALIRVPDAAGASARFEIRSPDPSCNPYLAYAGVVAAGLDGLDRGADPGDPVTEDIYEFDAAQRRDHGIGTLPATLADAVDALQTDSVIWDALGDHTAPKFVEAKEQAVAEYRATVTEWERDRYLRR